VDERGVKIKRSERKKAKEMQQNLPARLDWDTWSEIAGFDTGRSLGMVNHFIRDVVQTATTPYRHATRRGVYFVTEESIDPILGEFEFPEVGPFRPGEIDGTIGLIFSSFPPGVRAELRRFYEHLCHHGVRRRVRALNITVLGGDIAELKANSWRENRGHARVESVLEEIFRSLSAMHSLEELKLDFASLTLGVRGCRAFDILHRNTQQLQTLWIDFSGNDIGDRGCRELRFALKNDRYHHEHCQTLYLGLRGNQITHVGAACLHDFKDMKELKSLHIDLGDNLLGDQGVDLLTEAFSVEVNWGLQGVNFDTLHLGLTNNGIGDEGVKALRRNLSEATYLRHLHLDMGGNFPASSEGSESLREWMVASAHLRTLIINF
jgi:hypothetical protein